MAGLQPHIYATVGVTLALATTTLVLRLVARRLTRYHLWLDDYFCLVAFTFACGYCATFLICHPDPLAEKLALMLTFYFPVTVHLKLGQSIMTLDQDETLYVLEKVRMLQWINELMYASSLASSKLSIVSFYWRIFQHTTIRTPIRILLAACTLWIVVRTIMVTIQCLPVPYIWDKTIPNGRCLLDMSKFFFWTILAHCVMDVIILVLPIIPVTQMHLNWQQKLAIVGLFTSGIIVVIASIFVLVEAIEYNPRNPELTLEIAPFLIWGTVEVNMAVFSSCLPMLRPIFRHIIPSHVRSSDPNHSEQQAGLVRLSQIRLPPVHTESGSHKNGASVKSLATDAIHNARGISSRHKMTFRRQSDIP